MSALDQGRWRCRCEWGPLGITALARRGVTVIVDILSFSTCVDIATAHGVDILPFAGDEASARTFADARGAALAGPRSAGGYSLSPVSFVGASRGLRCVLPSPNGALLTLEAARAAGVVLTGCFRNANAVAMAARELGDEFNVCPAGERWPDGSLRPAVEDWVGAGAILAHLPGEKSPEALAAIAAWNSCSGSIPTRLGDTISGRELVERGYPEDIALASELDVSGIAPIFTDGAYRAWSP